MKSEEIRKKFLEFFEKRGHKVVPSSSLIPDDPSVLLTTAGMQQFKPYFVGKADPMKDFGNRNTVSVQKSFRTSDIDEVGDVSHLTFFEMLGNFSFGGYFKDDAIKYAHEFITGKEWMGLNIEYVTVFDPAKVPDGDWRKGVPFDKESEEIWKRIAPNTEIRHEGVDNFWGPTGSEGPCGPTTEIYVKNKEGKSIEIWNLVFNEFYCSPDKKLAKLEVPGVDTGMGLERLAMVSQNVSTIFETDLFEPIIGSLPDALSETIKRIVADHARAIVFLIADGVFPSNKDAGYVLRRLTRRYIFRMFSAGDYFKPLQGVIDLYKEFHPELDSEKIIPIFTGELSKFEKTLTIGLGELYKMTEVDAFSAFNLYQSYGLPYEVIKDYAGEKAKHLTREAFDKEFAKHQEISRAGQEKKFGGHGLILNTGELKAGDEEELKKVTRLHTATHMLQQALREVLGPEVKQAGSDITAERTRFDFAYSRKLTPEEIKKTEELVNQKIKEDLPMQKMVLPKEEAEKTGALYFFKEKYPDPVNVYFIGKDLAHAWSKEFCGGPHVAHTGEIGTFKILKEEAVGSGVRRIRGAVFP